MTQEELKSAAAKEAAATVRSGMRLGLGTGSTIAHFLRFLAERIASGEVEDIVGVPTSVHTASTCEDLGIPLSTLDQLRILDLTVDGADEVDPELGLIKGLGGALLREKMVAQASREFFIIVDDTKIVRKLGTKGPLPVEVIPFSWRSHAPFLQALGAEPELRCDEGGTPYVTDNQNYIVHCHFEEGIGDPRGLESALAGRAGIVGTGLFLDMATAVVVAAEDGIHTLTREDR
jgi:ribose 5-phosphate isomerase A